MEAAYDPAEKFSGNLAQQSRGVQNQQNYCAAVVHGTSKGLGIGCNAQHCANKYTLYIDINSNVHDTRYTQQKIVKN